MQASIRPASRSRGYFVASLNKPVGIHARTRVLRALLSPGRAAGSWPRSPLRASGAITSRQTSPKALSSSAPTLSSCSTAGTFVPDQKKRQEGRASNRTIWLTSPRQTSMNPSSPQPSSPSLASTYESSTLNRPKIVSSKYPTQRTRTNPLEQTTANSNSNTLYAPMLLKPFRQAAPESSCAPCCGQFREALEEAHGPALPGPCRGCLPC